MDLDTTMRIDVSKVYCYSVGYGIIAAVDKKRYDTPREIGEKVRIRSKLHANLPFGTNGDMEEMCGKIVTIKDRYRVNYTNEFSNIWSYKLQEIGYSWNEFMFEQEVIYEIE